MSIHQAIKARRVAAKLSQAALAKAINAWQPEEKPIGRQTIQHWENGTTAPKRTRMAAVAAALDTTPEALLAGKSVDIEVGEPGDPSIEVLAGVLAEIRMLNPHAFGKLAEGLVEILQSMRTTEEVLRLELGVPTKRLGAGSLGEKSTSEGGLLGGISGFGDMQEAQEVHRVRGKR